MRVLPWNPNADYTVWAIAVTGDGASVFAGGSFQNVGGQPAVRPGQDQRRAPAPSTPPGIRPSATRARTPGISSLRVQGNFVYGTSWHFGPGGNLEGTFKVPVDELAHVEWVTDCHGDNYSAS